MFTQDLPCFSSCLLPPILSLGTTEKSLAPLLYSSHREDPLSLFSSRLNIGQPPLAASCPSQSILQLMAPLLTPSLSYLGKDFQSIIILCCILVANLLAFMLSLTYSSTLTMVQPTLPLPCRSGPDTTMSS